MARTPTTQAAQSASQHLSKDLAKRAYQKLMAGQQPSAQERAALRHFEKDQEEKRRWEYYRAIPQKHWREMSGRQTKVINEQAQRYGIPFGGRVIDLPNVVRAMHDFLATNAHKLASGDELMQGDSSSRALERYREERARLAQLDRLERERVLVRRDVMREGMGRVASFIRRADEELERQFGPAAAEILREYLDDAQRETIRMFGNGDAESGDQQRD